MSLPVEADFALVKMGDGAGPEVFTIVCGINAVGINRVANTRDRFVRDCAKPGEVPTRKTRTTGKQLDISGSGLIDKAHIDLFEDALGVSKNFKIELYQADGTDTGDLMGTFAGPFVMTTANMNLAADSDSSAEINLANDGAWTWTAAA